jgi:hypothetical protein
VAGQMVTEGEAGLAGADDDNVERRDAGRLREHDALLTEAEDGRFRWLAALKVKAGQEASRRENCQVRPSDQRLRRPSRAR